jgi:hypothetical protein
VKLFEHPDFEQAIIRAAEHFRPRGLREAIIEKDYFVTEALRIIEQHAGSKIIFKGGTSLSKGWNLIQRFSEETGYPHRWASHASIRQAGTRFTVMSRRGTSKLPGMGMRGWCASGWINSCSTGCRTSWISGKTTGTRWIS